MNVKLYVEGGGNSKLQNIQCREGFRKLFEKAGFAGRMPRIVAGGSRGATYDMFRTAVAAGDQNSHPMLLVDSEETVTAAGAWQHLELRDGWVPPVGVTDDQAQLMVTCMETWIMADRSALAQVFGASLQTSALLPLSDLERRQRDEVQVSLEHATRNCGNDKAYRKGRRSFQVLGQLAPRTLMQHLFYFRRLIEALDRLSG